MIVIIQLNIHLLYNSNTTLDAESNSDLGTTFNFHAKRGLANSIFLILLKFCIFHNKTTVIIIGCQFVYRRVCIHCQSPNLPLRVRRVWHLWGTLRGKILGTYLIDRLECRLGCRLRGNLRGICRRYRVRYSFAG